MIRPLREGSPVGNERHHTHTSATNSIYINMYSYAYVHISYSGNCLQEMLATCTYVFDRVYTMKFRINNVGKHTCTASTIQ